jgi:hypothetical protein
MVPDLQNTSLSQQNNLPGTNTPTYLYQPFSIKKKVLNEMCLGLQEAGGIV